MTPTHESSGRQEESDRNGGVFRRRLLQATGAVLGSAALPIGAASAESTWNYELAGEALDPGTEEVRVQGDWAYTANGTAIATVDVSDPETPVLGGTAAGHGDDNKDVKVEGDLAALADDGEAAGVTFYDVSDPATPIELSFYDAASGVHNCFLDGDYAYLCINDSFAYSRMVIVDISDPSNPVSLEGEERGSGGAWMLRDRHPDMAEAGINPIHDLWVQDDLAYMCFWDAGVVVADVSDPTDPTAVAHFGAADYAADTSMDTVETLRKYLGGEKTNAHYVQPTPDGDYLLAGAETFGGTGHEEVGATGDFGGIRAFDVRDVAPLDGGGTAVYPEADGVADLPPRKKEPLEGTDILQRPPDRRNPENFVDYVAYIDSPDQPDDVLLTSHNFDVTETKVFTSWYQGGVRAFDLAPLYRGDAYEDHPQAAADIEAPEEIAAFDPDGMAFWTAVNLRSAQDGETYFTIGSDIGKGAVILELTDELFTPTPP